MSEEFDDCEVLEPEEIWATCGRCGGTGEEDEMQIVSRDRRGVVRMPVAVTCSGCGGSGQIQIQ